MIIGIAAAGKGKKIATKIDVTKPITVPLAAARKRIKSTKQKATKAAETAAVA